MNMWWRRWPLASHPGVDDVPASPQTSCSRGGARAKTTVGFAHRAQQGGSVYAADEVEKFALLAALGGPMIRFCPSNLGAHGPL